MYMVSEAKVKIYKVGSRHSINLPSALVTDSAFPFKPNEELTIRIADKKITIQKKWVYKQMKIWSKSKMIVFFHAQKHAGLR